MSQMTLIWYAIIGLLLLLVQMVVGYVSVENVTPDLILILAIYIAVREGQFAGLVGGFVLGLLFDLLSSGILGTNALAKMIGAFVAGYFYVEGAPLPESVGSFRFLGVVALSSLVHNLIFYFFFTQPSDLSFSVFFLRSGVAGALYTTVVAAIVMLAAARKQRD